MVWAKVSKSEIEMVQEMGHQETESGAELQTFVVCYAIQILSSLGLEKKASWVLRGRTSSVAKQWILAEGTL